MSRDPYHVSHAEALTVRCPTCRQRPGQPCVYMLSRPKGDYDLDRWPSLRKQVERVGTPTKAPHVERRALFRRARALPPGVRRVDPRLLAASRAMRDWDEQEFHRLRRWLISYGHILQ